MYNLHPIAETPSLKKHNFKEIKSNEDSLPSSEKDRIERSHDCKLPLKPPNTIILFSNAHAVWFHIGPVHALPISAEITGTLHLLVSMQETEIVSNKIIQSVVHM